MCYVHNQWYDISCATLYFKTAYVYTKHRSISDRGARCKHTPSIPLRLETWSGRYNVKLVDKCGNCPCFVQLCHYRTF